MIVKPSLSVIVPTYQGAKRILNTLAALERQRFRDFEAIVVIDGSTDDTKKIVEEGLFTFTLHVCAQQNKGRGGARNAGVAIARANTLVFLDDDLTFDANLLSQYHSLANEGCRIVVGSAYAVRGPGDDEFFDYAKYLGAKWESDLPATSREVLKRPYLNAQNCMISLEVFRQLGGFDERLRDAEDFDLAIKAFEKQIPIVLDREILVGHHLQPDFGTYARRLVEYEKARKMLTSLNADAVKHADAPAHRSYRKKIFYAGLSGQVWIDLIDKNVFRILPRKLRFRIYDLLLTAYSVTRTRE